MKTAVLIALMALPSTSALAGSLTTSHAVRPLAVVTAKDIHVMAETLPGTITSLDEIVGKEARVTLYPGRPIRAADVGAPALVARNQIVTLVFAKAGLRIQAEGRALGRGSVGEFVEVMNLDSRSIISGRINSNGSVVVSSSPSR